MRLPGTAAIQRDWLYGHLPEGASFVLVGVAHTLDATMLGSGSALRTATILFYLSNEGLSIVENAARMGLPIPDRLQEALKQLRK